MKNWSVIFIILVGLFFCKFSFAQSPQVIQGTDTLNISLINPTPGVLKLVYLGKIQASDPDGDELTYEIMPTPERRFFTLNKNEGYLYTTPKYLNQLMKMGEIELKVAVSDGEIQVTKNILLIFNPF